MRKYGVIERDFVERLGLLVESEGLPRIAGRIMGFLMLSEEACRAADLAIELKISHGSVSTNTRLLEQLGVIERVAIAGDRAAFYQMAKDPYGSLLAGQLQRMRRLHTLMDETQRVLPASRGLGRHRIEEIERFYRMAILSTEELLGRWSRRQPRQAPQVWGEDKPKLTG